MLFKLGGVALNSAEYRLLLSPTREGSKTIFRDNGSLDIVDVTYVPTKDLLAVETKSSFVLVVVTFEEQKERL